LALDNNRHADMHTWLTATEHDARSTWLTARDTD